MRPTGRVVGSKWAQMAKILTSITTYYSDDQMNADEMVRACGTCEGEEKYLQGFVGKRVGKGQFGRSRDRWECNIKRNLKQIGWGGIDWIYLDQDREKWRAVLNAVLNLGVP